MFGHKDACMCSCICHPRLSNVLPPVFYPPSVYHHIRWQVDGISMFFKAILSILGDNSKLNILLQYVMLHYT
jgi:hypothetical protein